MSSTATMRWEGQELNHGTPEGKFPEVLWAHFSLLSLAESRAATVLNRPRSFLKVDQATLDRMQLSGELSVKAKGVRIDRLCLRFRLACRLNPGGGRNSDLGVMQYWSQKPNRRTAQSYYAVVEISPLNDWLNIFVVAADVPRDTPSPVASDGSLPFR